MKIDTKGYIKNHFKERVCGICKKLIIPTPYWVYKIRNSSDRTIKYFCSYTCYRKAGGDSGKYEFYVRNKRK